MPGIRGPARAIRQSRWRRASTRLTNDGARDRAQHVAREVARPVRVVDLLRSEKAVQDPPLLVAAGQGERRMDERLADRAAARLQERDAPVAIDGADDAGAIGAFVRLALGAARVEEDDVARPRLERGDQRVRGPHVAPERARAAV